MLPLHPRHQQLLRDAFPRETPEEEFSQNDLDSAELNSNAHAMENMSMEKVHPSLRTLRFEFFVL